jgi:nucleotide-binding universal stress UspA family protein
VAARAPCPVVVVPPGAPAPIGSLNACASVVCGLEDGSCGTVELAAGLARRLGVRLILAHVESGGAERNRVSAPMDLAARLGPLSPAHARRFRPSTASTAPVRRPEVRLDRGDPAAGLERVAARESAELIVVGARRRGRITAGVLGAVCERLLSTASRPVVVVPPRVAAGGWAPLALEEGAR